MRILSLIFILLISWPTLGQVYPYTTLYGNLEIKPLKQNSFLNNSFLFEKSLAKSYTVKNYFIKNQADTIQIKKYQEHFKSLRIQDNHVSVFPQVEQYQIIDQSKNTITIEDQYWCGRDDSERSFSYSIDLKYNTKHQLTHLLQKYGEQDESCASSEDIEWKYTYKRDKLIKVNIHNKRFIEQFYNPDGRVRMIVLHGNKQLPDNLREKYYTTFKSYLKDEKKRPSLSSFLFQENLAIYTIVFYTYENELLTEVLSYDRNSGFLHQSSFSYNSTNQLTDFEITPDRGFGLRTRFIYDEKTSLLKQKIERRISDCYGRGCSEPEMIENYDYDNQNRIVKIDYSYGNYSLNQFSEWPSTTMFYLIKYKY